MLGASAGIGRVIFPVFIASAMTSGVAWLGGVCVTGIVGPCQG